MNNQLTPCYVSEMPGEKARALLIGFSTDTWTRPRSAFANGESLVHQSRPVAIVMFETGDVRCVFPDAVQIIDAEVIFREYAFPENDGSTSPHLRAKSQSSMSWDSSTSSTTLQETTRCRRYKIPIGLIKSIHHRRCASGGDRR